MASLLDLLQSLPIDSIAASIGETPEDTYQAAAAAIPALVGGMEANAKDTSAADSLLGALEQHKDAARPATADEIDTDDGSKIVHHVFGDNTDAVVNQLGAMGFSSGIVGKLLPMIAPFVLGWLAKNILGGGRQAPQQQAPQQAPQQSQDQGGILGGLLDKVLGGNRGEAQQAPAQPVPSNRNDQPPAGIDIGSILGEMLGQQRQSAPQQKSPLPGGIDLEDLLGGLGGLLGGGRR